MSTSPPPPPRLAARPSAILTSRSHVITRHRSVGPPLLPLSVLTMAAIAASVLALVASQSGAASTSHVSAAAVVGWCLGGVMTLLAFSWFRASNLGRQADVTYTEPAWRPTRVAALAAVIGWLTGVGCAVLIAGSVARR